VFCGAGKRFGGGPTPRLAPFAIKRVINGEFAMVCCRKSYANIIWLSSAIPQSYLALVLPQ
jgi:hypothetical protein